MFVAPFETDRRSIKSNAGRLDSIRYSSVMALQDDRGAQ